MLTNGTKRRIDTARDILVGKLPDPKTQVEQITIALIYKFMDDMDKQAEELGGNPKFFTGEYAKYAWSKIFDPRVSGHELVGLYGEAIQRMNQNPNIPQLFRNIFKNAYLPYRDPETLKSFLKTIGEFEYDHSEKLGDAFEYLLSVMGSQGDAGQFRTPRHIIDFIVEVVAPCKNETILDPACGTAGFLISSYKHILEKNKKDGRTHLTHDQRKRLIGNFSGYDISPDMVRLSLANMYLHGFQNPRIYEYDTLTSEEKWQETFDIILANPPFMSPRGGIKPHKRFSVQSKRSEVLFVDYMAEHLNPNGRAGIIVPEGIIFQSGTAYKKLRKMLIEQSLYAVVSLPAGVFNPYAGVKTSILMLDKSLAKKSDKILFVKVSSDGYGLGAQRREIKENDLPLALTIIKKYKQSMVTGSDCKFTAEEAKIGTLIEKEKIAESGDYNLSGDRYKEALVYTGKWDFVELGEVCDILNGYAFKSKNYVEDGIRVIRITNVQKGKIIDDDPKFYPLDTKEPIEKYRLKKNDLLISLTGNVGRVGLLPNYFLPAALNQRVACLRNDPNKIARKYLFHLLNQGDFEQNCIDSSNGVAQKNLSTIWLSKYKIPLPPIEVQEEIVAELDNYQKIIEGARQVVESYNPHIDIDPEWSMVDFGDVCKALSNGVNFSKEQVGRGTKFINIKDLFSDGYIDISGLERVELSDKEIERNQVFEDDMLFVRSSVKYEGVGFPSLAPFVNEPLVFCGFIIKASLDKNVLNPKFLLFLLRTEIYRKKVIALSNKANITNISQDNLKALKIPLPSLDIQARIVEQIELEQELIRKSKQLSFMFMQKIKNSIKKAWNK
jgi:type I restriction enzyme M protein